MKMISPQKSFVVNAVELKMTNPKGWPIFVFEGNH